MPGTNRQALRRAVGDLCLRFFDAAGEPVAFPGSERLAATPLDLLRRVPVTIALAAGVEKVPGIVASALAGYITDLVTDVPTALAVLESAQTDGPNVE